MLELKIFADRADIRKLMEYVNVMIESGITSGILTDRNGNRVGEWRYE